MKRPSLAAAARALAACCFFVVVAVDAGCAECADNFDCNAGLVCRAGACVGDEENGLTFAAPDDGAAVDDGFEAVVSVRFRGAEATLSLDVVDADACRPFVPDTITIPGNDEAFVDVDVPFAGLRAAGEEFTLRATLDVNGAVTVEDRVVRGPADPAAQGITLSTTPLRRPNVVTAPWALIGGNSATAAQIFVEPLDGDGVSLGASPRLPVRGGEFVAAIPLVRGPQIVWVESASGDVVRRCGVGLRGGPAGDDGGALEFTVLTDAPAWLQTSLQLSGDGGGVCDGTRTATPCAAVRRADDVVPQNADAIAVDGFNGVIEVAAVPVAFSEPVEAWVRVTRAGRHEALFGPMTVFASEGQSWIAGRVTVDGGVVVASVAVDEFTVGAPW